MSMKKSGRPRRLWTRGWTNSRRITGSGAPVEVITMSTVASAVASSSKGTAVPASARASSWARAQEEDGLAVEPREDLLRQLDRGERDGHRMPRDLRFRPHPLRNGERLGEERVKRGPDRLARLGERERILHLAQDLRLADHHRVEARRHAERVTNRLPIGVRIEDRLHGGRLHTAMSAELTERGGARLTGHVGDGVHLDPVARREDEDLTDDARRGDVAEQLAQLVFVDGELLPELHRRVAVREASDEERHQPPCFPGKSRPAPSVSTSAANPTMAKYAARRPCQPPAARPASVAA